MWPRVLEHMHLLSASAAVSTSQKTKYTEPKHQGVKTTAWLKALNRKKQWDEKKMSRHQ